MNPPFKHYPLFLRVILMLSMFFFNVGIVNFIATSVAQDLFEIESLREIMKATSFTSKERFAILFVQGLSSLGGFALTAMMFAVLESGEFVHHLRLKISSPLRMILFGLIAIMAAQFFLEHLTTLNKLLPLPEALGFLKEMQQSTEQNIQALLNFTDLQSLFIATIFMAVIPAIGEEIFFRGLLLGDLLKANVHPVKAIAVSGFVFTVFHLQFDNMLAIWFLGSFLSYLYYISGSIWPSVCVHFANNFVAILLQYLMNKSVINPEMAESSNLLYVTVISIFIFAGCLYYLNRTKNLNTFVLATEETDSLNEKSPS